jgi:Flp pilus assembly protein TadG
MKYQKGQAITEFAIIFPLFLILLLGLFFLFIYCYNLIALQTMSRDIARSMSVGTTYSTIQSNYSNGTMSNLMAQGYYVWNPADTAYFPEPAVNGNDVTVTLTAKSTGSYSVLPDTISVSTSMYKESTT